MCCGESLRLPIVGRVSVKQTSNNSGWRPSSLPENFPVPSPWAVRDVSQARQPGKAGLPTLKGLLLSERGGKIFKINTLELGFPIVRLNMLHSNPKCERMSGRHQGISVSCELQALGGTLNKNKNCRNYLQTRARKAACPSGSLHSM